jgi:hypothetical protein
VHPFSGQVVREELRLMLTEACTQLDCPLKKPLFQCDPR